MEKTCIKSTPSVTACGGASSLTEGALENDKVFLHKLGLSIGQPFCNALFYRPRPPRLSPPVRDCMVLAASASAARMASLTAATIIS